MTTHSTCVSGAPAGSHLASGAWRASDADVSHHGEDTVFEVSGDTLEMSDRMGRSFTAKLDGRESPYKGSDEFTSVSFKYIDSHTIERQTSATAKW
jgi:hypothetical protein